MQDTTQEYFQARADAAGDDRSRLRALAELALFYARTFQPMQGLKVVREALRLSDRLGNNAMRAQLLATATMCHYYRGDQESAMATGIDAYVASRDGDSGTRSHALYGIGMALLTAEAFHEAERALRLAIGHARALGDKHHAALCRTGLGFVLGDALRFTESTEQFRLAMKGYEETGDEIGVAKSQCNLGHVQRRQGYDYQKAGEEAEASRCFRQALQMYEGIGMAMSADADELTRLASIGEMHSLLGESAHAVPYFTEALAVAARQKSHWLRAGVLMRQAQAFTRMGALADAGRALRRALHEAQFPEAFSLCSECHEALAKHHRALGHEKGALEHDRLAEQTRREYQEALESSRKVLLDAWARLDLSVN